jgi:hypothetical protein
VHVFTVVDWHPDPPDRPTDLVSSPEYGAALKDGHHTGTLGDEGFLEFRYFKRGWIIHCRNGSTFRLEKGPEGCSNSEQSTYDRICANHLKLSCENPPCHNEPNSNCGHSPIKRLTEFDACPYCQPGEN